MIPTITKSRMNLRKFDILENPEDDSAVFFITPPEVYPDLFTLRFPSIVRKSRRGAWNLAKHKKSSFLSFLPNVLFNTDIEIVQKWVDRYSRYVLIGLNEHIGSIFSNEIDFCLALDYNYDKVKEKRTLYGDVEYQLKYQSNIQCLDILSSGLSYVLFEMTETFRVSNAAITIVPSSIEECSVPRKLAKSVAVTTNVPFIDNILHCDKQRLKNLSFAEKSKEWEHLYACADCIEFLGDVSGKTIFLIDDLYQSGTTLWSCARYLKQAGAIAVIGLVCVKSLRDTDNQ
jgi:predicted amidophosphoribosyltransferase